MKTKDQLLEESRGLLVKMREATGEEFANLKTAYKALGDEIAKLTDIESEEGKLEEMAAKHEEASRGRVKPEMVETRSVDRNLSTKREAFRSYLLDGVKSRALYQGNNSSGGSFVPDEEFVNEILMNVDNAVFFRKLTKVMKTNAKSLGIPSWDANPVAAWGSEIGTVTPDTTAATGKRELAPHILNCLVTVSRVQLNNAPNFASLVADRIGYAIGILEEQAFVSGNGVNQPLGVFTAHASGISTNRDVDTGAAITFDGIISTKYKLKDQYRNSKSCAWLMHRDVVAAVAKLKDNQNQYLWQPSKALGEPDTLSGFPIYSSEYAPNTLTGNGNYVAVFGDFSKYLIAENLTHSVDSLYEIYRLSGLTGMISTSSVDGMPGLEEAFARTKISA